jgi:hypothetical protein
MVTNFLDAMAEIIEKNVVVFGQLMTLQFSSEIFLTSILK